MIRAIEELGQGAAAEILRARAEEGRGGATLLFHGPQGLGKDFLARELMKMLNCLEPGRCGPDSYRCPSCAKVDHFNHPDFQYVFPVVRGSIRSSTEKSFQQFTRENPDLVARVHEAMKADPFFKVRFEKPATHVIGTVRGLLLESARKLYEGRVGVTVLSGAHLLTRGAANALLKILEEPPPNRQFVLTTESPGSLLPTILSRCQRVRFVPLDAGEVAGILVRFYRLDASVAETLAHRSQGLPGEAVRLHQEARLPLVETAREVFTSIVQGPASQVIGAAEAVAGLGRQEVLGVLDELVLLYRDTMVLADGMPEQGVVQVESVETLSDLARRGALGDPSRGLTRIEQARFEIQRNAYPKLALVRMALDLRDAVRAAAAGA